VKLQEKMHNNYILKDENAIYFECGYSCDNALYLKLGSEAFFITDGRYTVDAKANAKNCEVIEDRDLFKKASSIIKKSNIKKLSFDPNEFSYKDYVKLSSIKNLTLKEKDNLSKNKRIIKNKDEIYYLHKASKKAKKIFDRFALYLQNIGLGKSEQQLSFKLKEILTKKDKNALSFDPIVAINENSALPHAVPTQKKLQSFDTLLIDAGIKYKRYCSDRTVTSIFGKTINFSRSQLFNKKKVQKIYDIVLKSQQSTISKIRPGMKAKDIDKIARDVIDKAGYGKYFVHSTGHGVGLDIHELPVISSKSDTVIEDGMVFTVEPGIYLEGEFGVRIEDTIVVKNDRAEIL
jgi:Xaa-Pro aminopeptidase